MDKRSLEKNWEESSWLYYFIGLRKGKHKDNFAVPFPLIEDAYWFWHVLCCPASLLCMIPLFARHMLPKEANTTKLSQFSKIQPGLLLDSSNKPSMSLPSPSFLSCCLDLQWKDLSLHTYNTSWHNSFRCLSSNIFSLASLSNNSQELKESILFIFLYNKYRRHKYKRMLSFYIDYFCSLECISHVCGVTYSSVKYFFLLRLCSCRLDFCSISQFWLHLIVFILTWNKPWDRKQPAKETWLIPFHVTVFVCHLCEQTNLFVVWSRRLDQEGVTNGPRK